MTHRQGGDVKDDHDHKSHGAHVPAADDARSVAPRQRARRRSSSRDTERALVPSHPAAEVYRQEKARRVSVTEQRDPLEEARKEYEKMLLADAAAGKGGRPKKVAKPVVVAEQESVTAEHEIPELTGEFPIADLEADAAEVEVEAEAEPARQSRKPAKAAKSAKPAKAQKAQKAQKSKHKPPPKKKAAKAKRR